MSTPPIHAEVYGDAKAPAIPDPSDSSLQRLPRSPVPQRSASTELLPPEPPIALIEVHRGASVVAVNDEQAAILAENVPDHELEILPTGEVYASQVRYREKLNRAFRPMGWALVPISQPKRLEHPTQMVIQEWALYVGGNFVARAWGEQDYDPKNDRMSWASALEGAKSTALVRCCKDLGIASQCWDRRFTEDWRRRYAIKVFVKNRNRPLWRRRDAEPFFGEEGVVPDPPSEGASSGVRATRPVDAPRAAPTTASPMPNNPTVTATAATQGALALKPDPTPAEDVSQESATPEDELFPIGQSTYVLQSIRSHSGSKDGKDGKKEKWTRWTIEAMGDGGEIVEPFHTFDTKVADLAQRHINSAEPCAIVSERTNFGLKILEILPAE